MGDLSCSTTGSDGEGGEKYTKGVHLRPKRTLVRLTRITNGGRSGRGAAYRRKKGKTTSMSKKGQGTYAGRPRVRGARLAAVEGKKKEEKREVHGTDRGQTMVNGLTCSPDVIQGSSSGERGRRWQKEEQRGVRHS